MVSGVIYVHINKLNGRAYVGQTWQEVDRRWRKTSKTYLSYRTTEVFFKALQKYGWENFESIILCSCRNQEDMNHMEEYFIKFYNSLAPNGYNLRALCDGREKHTESSRLKMSERALNRDQSKYANPWNKTQIVEIEGKKYKKCWGCLKHLELEPNFSKVRKYYKSRCHKCSYLYKPYEKMDPELRLESIKQRGEKFKQIHGTPERREFYKKLHSKAIQQLDLNTKAILKEYDCASDAKKDGFSGACLSVACNKGTPYKGFLWQFKT